MIAHDRREHDSFFSGRSDHANPRGLLADLLFDFILSRICILSPPVRRIPDLDPASIDPEIYGLLGFSRYPQSIVASRAQFGTPESTDVGFRPQTGSRSLSADDEAARRRTGGARHRSHHKKQWRFRGKRIQFPGEG